jgi:SRSO17 transposase
MIERAIAAGMPFARVAADALYGVGDIEQVLRRAGKGDVLGVKDDHRFGSWGETPVVAGTAAQIANGLDPAASVGGAGYRWAIEDSLKTAMNELGRDHNATHPWHGWISTSRSSCWLPHSGLISAQKHDRNSRPTDSLILT